MAVDEIAHFASKKKRSTFCVGFDFIMMPRNGIVQIRRIVSFAGFRFDGFIGIKNDIEIYRMSFGVAAKSMTDMTQRKLHEGLPCRGDHP